MAYKPYEWNTNSYVNPTRMNYIEAGIKANSDDIEEIKSKPTKAALYCKCESAANVSAKVVTCDAENVTLEPGTVIYVLFTNTNTASNVSLNVNNSGSKPVRVNNQDYTANSNSYCGYANRTTYYIYDGFGWAYIGKSWDDDTNTDTIPAAYCVSAANIYTKTATCTDYTLTPNTYTHILFKNANTAKGELTLNINNKGEKPIWINGVASSAENSTLPAGTYIAFYDGTNYHIRTDGAMPGMSSVNSEEDSVSYSKLVPGNVNTADLQMLGGTSEKWNQLNNNNGSTITTHGVTFEKLDALTWRVYGQNAGTNTYVNARYKANENFFSDEHTYFFSSGSSRVTIFGFIGTNKAFGNNNQASKLIVKSLTRTANGDIIRMAVKDSDTAAIDVTIKPFCVDLTAIFGSGNEPTSVDDDRIKWIEAYASEHPDYDEGSIIDAKVEQIVSRGKNLWDEQWEIGGINNDSGAYESVSNFIRSKNILPIKPNTTYFRTKTVDTTRIFFYDASKKYISNNAVSLNAQSFTTPSNAFYFAFKQYGTTYNKDIAIIEGTSGEYIPYFSVTKPIPTSIQSLPDYGKGINAECYNYVDFKPTVYHNMKSVDLGDLNWVSESEYGAGQFRLNIDNTSRLGVKYNGKLVCSKFLFDGTHYIYNQMPDNTIALTNSESAPILRIRDSKYSSVAEAKAALSGVILHYEATEGGEDYETRLYHHRVGVVDLGSLAWSDGSASDGTHRRMYSSAIASIVKKPSASSAIANIMCGKYSTISADQTYSMINGIAIHANGNVFAYDENIQNSADFKTAMNGVMCYYELETEGIYDVTDSIPPFEVESGGEITFENEANLAVPNTINYRNSLLLKDLDAYNISYRGTTVGAILDELLSRFPVTGFSIDD